MRLSIKSYTRWIVLAVFAVLGFAARVHELPFSYGVSFTFGSVFIFIILRYYGLVAASLVAVIINLLDWYLFHSSIYTLFFTMEVFVVGILWRNKQRNLFLLDVLFWIVIGAPASALLFYVSNGALGVEGSLIVVNNSINGLLNVLIAEILFSYIPIQYILRHKEKNLADLNKMMFHLTIAAVLGPFLVYTLVDGLLSSDKTNYQIYQILNTSGSSIMEQVQGWDAKDLRKIRLRSPFHLKQFEKIVSNNLFNEDIEIFLVDKSCSIYVTNQEMAKYNGVYDWKQSGYNSKVYKNVYQWLPAYDGLRFDISQWSNAFHIMVFSFDNIDLQLLVKVPLTNYTKSMWENYLNKFLILLFFCFISVIISIMVSRFLSRDLSKLSESTTGLPDKLKRQEVIGWPNTSIAQVNTLVSNFQVMSDNLVTLFNEAKIMNNQLLFQTRELESSREQMRHLAYYDALTDLPNRLYFTGYLEELLRSAQGNPVAVMFIDLNRFKQINDTLGHEVGDMLIKEVANRLSCFLKDDSFVARLGGDEFVVVLKDADKKKATKSAIYINKALARTVKLSSKDQVHELYVSGSIGVSLYPDDAQEKSTLLKYADLAMYAAKETGENAFRFYSELAESNMSEKLFLEQGLCRALDRDEIIINYQPKIDVKDKKMTGMEALVRWNHPELGLIPPSDFIPLAEETGIINQIGEWVLIEACKQNKEWQQKGYPKMRVSVNISLRQFRGNHFVSTVLKALENSGLDPEYLELEITEGFLIKNTDFTISVLEELSRIGVYISIDDFGTGYSSLGRLKELPINFLKIDKSFIKDISIDKNNNAIVAAIIQLAHSMELKVVAEGVETIEDWDALAAMGCDEVQGYLISKPVSRDIFEELIQNSAFPINTHN